MEIDSWSSQGYWPIVTRFDVIIIHGKSILSHIYIYIYVYVCLYLYVYIYYIFGGKFTFMKKKL